MRQSFGVVVGIAIAAAGCASGAFNSERPASQLYTISAAPPGTPATTVLPVDLAVARPLPRPGLDTERIAVRYADRRVDYYAVARWGASSLLVAKFVPGFASIASALAGAVGTRAPLFLLFDALGAALWAGSAIFLGTLFSAAVDEVLKMLKDGLWQYRGR